MARKLGDRATRCQENRLLKCGPEVALIQKHLLAVNRIPNSFVAIVMIALGYVGVVSCSYPAKFSLDIPEGPAVQTLKEFAKQADVEIVFRAPSVGEIRTNAVSGHMTPESALNAMLSGTSLVFDIDSETGAYAVTLDESLDTADNLDSHFNYPSHGNSVTSIANSNYKIKKSNSF